MNHVSRPVGDHLELYGLNSAGVDRHTNLHAPPSLHDTSLQLCIRVDAH